jgi:ATP-binding cassette subfamily B protein
MKTKYLPLLKNAIKMLREIFAASKARLLLLVVLCVFNTVNLLVSTFFIKYILDGILAVREPAYFIVVVAIRLGVMLLFQLCENISINYIYKKLDLKIKFRLSMKLFSSVRKIDLGSVENPEFFDKYQRAISEIDWRAGALIDTLYYALNTLFSLAGLIAVIATMEPALIFVAVLGMAVTVWANIINTKRVYASDYEFTEVNRGMDYIRRVFYLLQFSKDIRRTHLPDYMQKRYEKQNDRSRALLKKHWPPIIAITISGSWLFNAASVGVSSVYLALRAIAGMISIGDVTAFSAATSQLSYQLLQISNVIPQFIQHSLYIQNYFDVTEHKTLWSSSGRNIKIPRAGARKIDLSGVTFKYPGGVRPALNNVSVTFSPGEKVAIVGENGAGKTTLVKLIAGLYQPEAGELTIDDITYGDADRDSLYGAMSVVDQDFQMYALTLRENIALLDGGDIDDARVREIIRQVGLEKAVADMPNGIHTEYTREFSDSGVELSGGQLQRLAIGRALYHDSGLLIMDEPSSALDPFSEQEIYELMHSASEGKTLIVISHRLSSVKDMDRILVMSDGEITESGTHRELMALGGRYSEMFTLQARRYVVEDDAQAGGAGEV